MIRPLIVVVLAFSLGGCSWMTFGLFDEQNGTVREKGPSIGRVVDRLPSLDLPRVEDHKPTREEVMSAYNRVYGMLPTVQENYAVGKRLADLHMDRGQDLDVEGAAAPYDPAVSMYEELLTQQGAENLDEILYQLARAADITGNPAKSLEYLNRLIREFPQSAFMAEARFRRAEFMFSAEDYRGAAADYAYVVGLGEVTPYFLNASYMLGWSEFKRSRFDEGLHEFFNVVDHLLESRQVDALETIENELLEDSFRVVTLALAYLDGAQTLADEMRLRGKPRWQYLAYQRLADDYFEKERFLDNVATWQTFIEHNTLDPRAPAAHQGMIKTLVDAGFPSDVIPKKKEFVVRYGIYSEFWSRHPEDVRAGYIDTLHEYLTELARLAHADAQAYTAETEKQAKRRFRPEQRKARFLTAAEWYEELIVTFPSDPRTADGLFARPTGWGFPSRTEFHPRIAAIGRLV